MRRQVVAASEGRPAKGQHKKPCSDCPWARTAMPGWTGNMTPDEWLQALHGEAQVDCHTQIGAQCAGGAIYRANVCKTPRDRTLLRLVPNTKLVFSSPSEFVDHHTKGTPMPKKKKANGEATAKEKALKFSLYAIETCSAPRSMTKREQVAFLEDLYDEIHSRLEAAREELEELQESWDD